MTDKVSMVQQADFSRSLAMESLMKEFQQHFKIKGQRISCNMQKMQQSLQRRKVSVSRFESRRES